MGQERAPLWSNSGDKNNCTEDVKGKTNYFIESSPDEDFPFTRSVLNLSQRTPTSTRWTSVFSSCRKSLKSRPGVNFINVLREALKCADPKSAKKTVKLSVFFALLGFTGAKAAHRTLMKLIWHQHFKSKVYLLRSHTRKMTLMTWLSICAFRICWHKIWV